MVDQPNGRSVMFDQDAHDDPPRPTSRLAIAVTGTAALLLVGGGALIAVRADDAVDRPPADLSQAIIDATPVSGSPTEPADDTVGVSPATTVASPTTTPSTTAAPTTAAPATTVAPTTAPTTLPPTTAPPTTAPPTTAPPTTLPPTTVPTDGPGSPLIHTEVFASGIRAADAQPFFLRVQRLADAWATGDFDLARQIDLRSRAGSEYEERFAGLRRSSLILVDAGVAGSAYELLVVEVNFEVGDTTRLHCAQYVSDGTTGNVVRRGGFELGTYDRNISPEELRAATSVFDGLLDRCSFATVEPSLS